MILLTTNVILDYDETPMKNGPEPAAGAIDTRKELTVRDAIYIALNNWPDVVPTEEQKVECFRLSTAAFSAAELDLTLDDAAFIKKRAGAVLSVLLYGRLSALLEAAREGNPFVDAPEKREA